MRPIFWIVCGATAVVFHSKALRNDIVRRATFICTDISPSPQSNLSSLGSRIRLHTVAKT